MGSGPGGGTLAARLAESGATVVLLEAGGDPRTLNGGDPLQPQVNRLPADYDVPAFHAFASENRAISWDFFVRHYAGAEPVYYPRCSGLGGCSAHNAMILVYPQNSDWDGIAQLTGDDTWRAGAMRRYFEKLERCEHRPLYKLLAKIGINPTRHGWRGWLRTERALPVALLANRALAETIVDAGLEAFAEDGQQVDRIRWFIESGLDPNDWRLVERNSTGIRYLPLTTNNHARTGARERVLDVANRLPERLTVITDALVTRVLFDSAKRATGVEYLRGERLYRAHSDPSPAAGVLETLNASREVILSAGAFNSPQILMLSGIGAREDLEAFDIPVIADLPGVGRNLQDRYEIGVVNRMAFDRWHAYENVEFRPGDGAWQEWNKSRTGIYSTNGSVLTLFRRSPVAGDTPDLFCMSLLARFAGYFPGYSRIFQEELNYLTWVVLKAHTRNRSGRVRLRSTDPRDAPDIEFNYFQDGGEEDLTAVVDGIRFVRRLSAKLKNSGLIAGEEVPGEDLQTDEQLKQFVRANAWGHHASCTCPIGQPSAGGVLSSDFRVHGVSGLRVVDASVFPRIPGFFISSSVYMIAEKAADAILASRNVTAVIRT
ncbi:MAG TPA: GMC family oxidoreductase [Bryobacteraceae bacterium]|nr:GMC family oxidoreductase [Bryobacteraceae bacterium]